MIEKNKICHCKKCIRCENFEWEDLPKKDRSDLIGKFYDCICNPMTGGYSSPIKHHTHIILDAVEIQSQNHIYDGLALVLDVGGIPGRSVYGCKEKNIVSGNDANVIPDQIEKLRNEYRKDLQRLPITGGEDLEILLACLDVWEFVFDVLNEK